ncbi:MAG: Tim44-like domain-containing protein, partial [Spirochaetes bacterium]|nr:Tim44-like domain-containing protein [Spirochaetota bacterium]
MLKKITINKNIFNLEKIFYAIVNNFFLRLLFLCIFFFLTNLIIFSRAGGAGGGSSSSSSSGGGGGDDGIGALIYILIYVIPFPYNVIAVIIILIIAGMTKKKAGEQTVFNKLPTEIIPKSGNQARGYDKFFKANPEFNEKEFIGKVKTAFLAIQNAWMKQDLKEVRKFISDGVYQRFNTQFKMMKLLDQVNLIEKVHIFQAEINKIESDGSFDIIHVAIHAQIKDIFKSNKYPQFNEQGDADFIEYWSFIKKHGIAVKDIYHSNNCPKCGSELPLDSGEVSRCAFCKTITNLGEYDWILAEITQADDYVGSNPRLANNN